MNKLLLKLVMLPAGIWKNMGADVAQLEAILSVKLKMDDRKPLSFGRQTKKENKYSSILQSFMSFVMGAMYVFPLMALNDSVLSLWAYFQMFMFMGSFMMITDFSNVLIDTRDKYVLLPRPVNDRTLFLSRTLHVFIYLFRILFPMALPGWIVMGMMGGWKAAVWFPLPLFLTISMILFFVNGFYMLLQKLTTPERFKEILNFFQIVVSVLIFGCYYLLPRAMDSILVQKMTITDLSWIRFTPAYWLAATWMWMEPTSGIPGTMWMSALAIVVPLGCLWLTVKWLVPNFAANLGGMDAGDGPVTAGPVKKESTSFYKKISNLLNKNGASAAGFNLAWLQTSRSRNFKMKVLPTFAYMPIYFVFLLSNKNKPFAEAWHDMSNTHNYILLLYMTAFPLMGLLNYISISEHYKAAWIFHAMPVDKPGKVMGGAFKAVWVKFFLPFFALVSIFALSIWGPKVLVDILLAMSNITLFALLVQFTIRTLPFSKMEQMDKSGGKVIRTFLSFGFLFGVGFAHGFATDYWWLMVIFLPLSLIALWLVWDSFVNTGWEKLVIDE